MSFNLATKVKNIANITSFLLDNLQDLATNEAAAISLMNYYIKSMCDGTLALRNSPTFKARRRG